MAGNANLRNAAGKDAEEVLADFNKAHGETDFLTSYPDEKRLSVEEERDFLSDKEQSDSGQRSVQLLTVRSSDAQDTKSANKIKHRAEFGISIEKEYWGLGIGRLRRHA